MAKSNPKADAQLAKDVRSLENAKNQDPDQVRATLARINKNIDDNK